VFERKERLQALMAFNPSPAPTRYPAPGYSSLHAEDRLILVTDGVTDAENASGDFFGDSRLESVAAWRDVGKEICYE
jgi:Stage II sporulation protein E (SpoIIE)